MWCEGFWHLPAKGQAVLMTPAVPAHLWRFNMQVESLYLRQSRPTVELSYSSIDLTLEPTQDEKYIFLFQPYQNVN